MTGQRERLLVELLRNMGFAIGSSAGASNVHAATRDRVALQQHEDRCRLMREGRTCTCWIRSVTELQRCLRLMYRDERLLFRSVYERFVVCDCRPRTVVKKGNRVTVDGYAGQNFEVLTLLPRGNGVARARVETWRADILNENVDAGIAWLAKEFRGSPELPVEWKVEAA